MTEIGTTSGTPHKLTLGELRYEIRRDVDPVLTVASGDVVLVETEDAFSGQVRKIGDRRDRKSVPYGNPVAGPIEISGAEAGDSLVVTIEKIEPLNGQCATYLPPLPYVVEHLGVPVGDQTRICPISEGQIRWSNEHSIPYAPLVGVIAVAPALGTPRSGDAGDFGGNLDLKEMTTGAQLHLPVLVPGALVYVGDCHAAQVDGELSKVGLEMAAAVTLSFELVKERNIPGPRIASANELAAVAVDRSLERAIPQAYGRLAIWLEQDFGWDRWDAYALLAHVAPFSVGYFGNGVAAARVNKEFIVGSGRSVS